jgi:hypothetical protein
MARRGGTAMPKKRKRELEQSTALVPVELIENKDDVPHLLWCLDLLLREINRLVDALAKVLYGHD